MEKSGDARRQETVTGGEVGGTCQGVEAGAGRVDGDESNRRCVAAGNGCLLGRGQVLSLEWKYGCGPA